MYEAVDQDKVIFTAKKINAIFTYIASIKSKGLLETAIALIP